MPSVDERVARNVSLGPYALKRRERRAARYLFSLLGDLETIAVVAAERGDCIAGQLEDELVHRDSFYQIADRLGGRLPTSEPIARLVHFLKSIEGPLALALINVVAERWLEAIFRAVGESELAPELFRIVGDEEARHVREALALAKPDPEDARPLMRELEDLLKGVARDPFFLAPLSFLIGERETAKLGLGNVRAHAEACQHLGLVPGPAIRKIEATCKATIRKLPLTPRPWTMNDGEISKFNLNLGAMQDSVEIPCDEVSPATIEAEGVRALGLILSRFPKMNRTIRAGKLWKPREVVIGVRREHSLGQLTTVYVHSPQYKSADEIKQEIRRKIQRLRRRPYERVEEIDELIDFFPAPRCAATVTQTSEMGVRRGFAAPPTDAEGSPIAVCIGDLGVQAFFDGGTIRPQRLIHLGVRWDHRAADGREIGKLIELLPQELQHLQRRPKENG